MADFAQLVVVAAAVMGIAQSVTKEQLFAPLRDRLGGKETWTGYLVSCPWCFSHWLAFILVPLTGTYPLRIGPRWPILSPVIDTFLSAIVVVVVAAFLRVAFYLVDESQGLTRRRNKAVDKTLKKGSTSRTPAPVVPGELPTDPMRPIH